MTAPYTIYHLNVDDARLGKGNLGEEAKDVLTALYSNSPRFDPTISYAYPGSIVETLPKETSERTARIAELEENYRQQRLNRKIAKALALFKNKYYVKVAHVDTKTADKARMDTTSINIRWWLKPSKTVEVLGEPWRSTDSYDIVKRFDEAFLILPLGYINLSSREFSRGLV